MMIQPMDPWSNLITRMASRKFLLCILVVALALIGFFTNHMTFDQMTTTILTTVGIFTGAEGLVDAASQFGTKTIITNPTVAVPDPPLMSSPPPPPPGSGIGS
jgi:hypothetical protein